jgi:GNAT superfamily N-acetyltransferase
MGINYEPYQNGDEISVCKLAQQVFDEFVAPGYSELGRETFRSYVEPAALQQRIDEGIDFILLAKDGPAIIGVLAMKNTNHISLLFVDKRYHRQGIARELYWRTLIALDIKTLGIHRISVHASPYAVPVYEHLGFQKTGAEREENGIRYTLMEAVL